MSENFASPKWFRVGIATDPQPNDKIYDELHQAIDRAKRMYDAHSYDTPVAVWDEQHVIVYLFVCGQQFRNV